jgi:hypothetical protein
LQTIPVLYRFEGITISQIVRQPLRLRILLLRHICAQESIRIPLLLVLDLIVKFTYWFKTGAQLPIYMKLLNHFLHSVFPLPALINLALLTPFFLCLLGSLIRFYKTKPASQELMQKLEKLNQDGIKFIVHSAKNTFLLKNVNMNSDILSGEKEILNPESLKHRGLIIKDIYGLPVRMEKMIHAEVHLYTNNSFEGSNQVILAINQIRGIDLHGPGNFFSRSEVKNILGILVSVAAVAGAIIVACSITWNAVRAL